jgi:hypothetical protein
MQHISIRSVFVRNQNMGKARKIGPNLDAKCTKLTIITCHNNMACLCLMRCVYYKCSRCDLKTFHSARLSGAPMSMYSSASLVCKLFIQDIHRTLCCLDAPNDDRVTCSIISHKRNRVVPGSAPQFVASTSMA